MEVILDRIEVDLKTLCRSATAVWPEVCSLLVFAIASLALALPAAAAVDSGATIYLQHCAECHEGNVPRAPHSVMFNMSQPEDILAALNEGVMRAQAAELSAAERVLVANFLAGASTASNSDQTMAACTRSTAPVSSGATGIAAWGVGTANQRFVDTKTAGLTRDDVSGLELKWAFDFPGATRARSQPTIHGDVVYVGSQHGFVYALDLDSGCAYWRFKADAEVRSAISIAPSENGASPMLYFGDTAGNVYGISGADGKLIWRSNLEDHPEATITGSLRYHDGRLFVPMSSREWASAADPSYACCTFRGGIVAFSAHDGKRLWKSYSIPEPPADTGRRNPLDVPVMAPSGAPVWNAPTVDVERGLLYVGTGESYTSPAATTSDAVLAFAIETGRLVWSKQLTAGDAWNMSCFIGSSYNCPEENGPDMDIGAPPVLVSLSSEKATAAGMGAGKASVRKDILVVGQKNGFVYGLDPDNKGAIVWERKVGLGGYAGGIHWGLATDGTTIYAPNADTDFIGRYDGERFPGVFALDAATGEQLWFTRAQEDCRRENKPACDPGISAAATAIPGLVFAGAFDGQLRAYDSADGKVLWRYQTNRAYTAVSGRKAHGGSIESDGPVVYRGHVLVNSGYLFGGRMPGNVLLNFALPQPSGQAVEESE